MVMVRFSGQMVITFSFYLGNASFPMDFSPFLLSTLRLMAGSLKIGVGHYGSLWNTCGRMLPVRPGVSIPLGLTPQPQYITQNLVQLTLLYPVSLVQKDLNFGVPSNYVLCSTLPPPKFYRYIGNTQLFGGKLWIYCYFGPFI